MSSSYGRKSKTSSGRTSTNYRLITFQVGILGIDFRDNVVTCVTKGGQAEKLGVRAGWRILEISGEKVVGARSIVKVVKRINKEKVRYDVLFATPNWVKIEIPAEIGGGFLTMRVVDGTKVYQLKKQILKKCKTRRVASPKTGQSEPDFHHSCFVITDDTKELQNEEIFEPATQNLGTTRLVRISKVRKSRRKTSTDEPKNVDEKKPPPMVSLTSEDNETTQINESVKMEFVRVNIPEEAGGGFITLRAKVGTSKSTLQKLAMEKIEQRRGNNLEVLEIDGSEMTVSNSRVDEVIPKEKSRPKNNIDRKCEMLMTSSQFCKLKHLRITFTPGLIGIGWRGNRVTAVLPNSQAERAGVSPGWEVLAVNGKTMPNNADAISEAIRETKDSGRNIELLFSPNKLPPGTEVMLHNLKRNARLNGMTAQIVKCLENNKYDISILNASTRISVRGISGNYFKIKDQEQFWVVINAGGAKIYKSKHVKSEGVGYLRYDTVVRGIRKDQWLQHSKGYSRLSNGEVQLVAQSITRKYGVVWPLSYKRKEIYFQNSRSYDARRRDVAKMIAIAEKRQRKLEQADRKRGEVYTTKQWNKFWESRNKFFAKYYKFISTGKHDGLKGDQKENDLPEQIDMPDGYAEPEPEPEQDSGSDLKANSSDMEFDTFDIITASPAGNNHARNNHELNVANIFSTTASDDPFADKPDDPFADKPYDPFADKPDDPFADKSNDPFADKPEDPFAIAFGDPFAEKTNDPFADTSGDPFAGNVSNDPFADVSGDPFADQPNDPFADASQDPFADLPNEPKKTPMNNDDFLASLFDTSIEDTTLVSS